MEKSNHSSSASEKPRKIKYSAQPLYSPKRMIQRSDGRSIIKHPGVTRISCYGKIKDAYHTLLDSPWYKILAFCCVVYTVSWVIFAALWLAVEKGTIRYFNVTCIGEGESFRATLLFSIETQVTIGYGRKAVADDCHAGIVLLMMQSLIGLFLDSFLLGLLFAKIVRPRQRRKSIMFSDNAVIHDGVDGERVLEFRIHNLRRSQLVEAHVRLYLYWYIGHGDKERDLHCYDLDVGYTTGRDRLLLIAPVIVTHYIDKFSPLCDLDNDSILDQDLEVVVVLEAIVESTGLTAQALWSYTGREILIDHMFVPMVSRRGVMQEWVIDIGKINKTVAIQRV